ncbi:MAG: hypothetical protein B7Y43_13110 [Sphingomonas sp. 28-62-20]|uniref:hypothetical protein n=1 Tax=Sphingomonas sp. 28-62-20 TaxID=1970433 RepID=UPI000BD0FC59|nr:MAG: hypothetical protein B7Y43_13110 [Sphingomonas sp. 28-62-20]
MATPAFLTAIAAIIAALAWPIVLLTVLLAYRKPISSAVTKIPSILDRIQTVKIGALEAELEKVASLPHLESSKGEVTPEQIRTAAKIESQATDFGSQQLIKQLDRICLEYDTIRNTMPSGYARTSAMTQILIKMRALAPSTSKLINVYKGSGSPGSRLAAVAMMQMEPQLGDLNWLEERFVIENPFIFYHAALALRNMTIHADSERRKEISLIAKSAKSAVERFEYGVPDPDTIEVLSSI